jgi:PiT family inorganic phosphate transporter
MQRLTVCVVASGHGFNDGLKYVGVVTLVLLKAGIIQQFKVLPQVIIVCAAVMGIGTMLAGWRIHERLDKMVNGNHRKSFKPYMGVSTELTAGFAIWQTGWLGIPMSTTHSVVAAMAGARSAAGKVHVGSVIRILWGWIITYVFCFIGANLLTHAFLG